ncbi:M64 family metallopeptidase [Tahibacter amnicola]|uniref:M64 family metallopeptidase n=1 Tax=Tahibacter amnicola TaxID=2976241 RepID=A0ABY6BI04_9GAMM|nr:M64 family metallopeptidase [Tahibacter amnicola]UXI69407.1 M64 family metallopeptidase [Tahibacter amnicola]
MFGVAKRGVWAAVALLGGSGTALAVPGHYVVFSLDGAGAPRPVYYTEVDLAMEATDADAMSPARAGRLDDTIALRTVGDKGRGPLQQIPLIRTVRGEFARDPERGDHHIDAFAVPNEKAAFVVRVPIEGARAIELDYAGKHSTFDLDALRGEASRLPLATRAPAVTLRQVGLTGNPANRVDILVLGDGYTAAEQSTFDAHTATFRTKFFDVSPYKEYESFVNWTTGFVASAESGADHPQYQAGCTTASCCGDSAAATDPRNGMMVNTAFDAQFCYYQIHRLLVVNASKLLAAAAAYPNWDKIAVTVNDPVYGGSGGQYPVSSAHASANLIFLHEYGHSFHYLADEYSTPYPGFPACSDLGGGSPCEANVTDQTTAGQVKWATWFTSGNPIPTPAGTAGTGLFQGARYQTSGMYRPTDTQCLMRSLGTTFCPVCRQEYILQLYRGQFGVPANGIDLIEPGTETPSPAAPVSYVPGSTVVFQATLLSPTIGGLTAQWFLDGMAVGAPNQPTYSFTQAGSTPASRSLELRVTDTTSLVSPVMSQGLTVHSRTWTIQVGNDLIFRNGFQ